MKRRYLLPLIGLNLLCLLAFALLGVYIPAQARALFGPPGAGIGLQERITYAALLYTRQETLLRPADPTGAEQTFVIAPGESTSGIIGRLWEAGLISDSVAFRTYLQYKGLDTTLQAGEYSLSPALSPVEIAYRLQDATPEEITFTILAGWRLEEIAAALPTSGLPVETEAFLREARSPGFPHPLEGSLPSGASLEGFLLPDTYTLPRETDSPTALLLVFLTNFDTQVTPEIRRGLETQGLTLYEGVTLASMVQREAVVAEEMPLIASVFLNRLRQGMRLESDPTVQYAIGFDASRGGWWPVPLTGNDLGTNSAYNTYQHPGLPPGPIASPGLNALRAAAFPAQTPYLYFRAACDGSGRHTFAETYEEHLKNGECGTTEGE